MKPDLNITVKEHELVRALSKRTANYDMDCEDEEWLNKLNSEFYAEKEMHELGTPENFELIIDVLENGFIVTQMIVIMGKKQIILVWIWKEGKL